MSIPNLWWQRVEKEILGVINQKGHRGPAGKWKCSIFWVVVTQTQTYIHRYVKYHILHIHVFNQVIDLKCVHFTV